jgi:hypothetical protein
MNKCPSSLTTLHQILSKRLLLIGRTAAAQQNLQLHLHVCHFPMWPNI